MDRGPVDLVPRRPAAPPPQTAGCTDEHRWLELVSAAADGELGPSESAALAGHLAACPSCASVLAAFEHARRRARMRPAPNGHRLIGPVLDRSRVERRRTSRARTATWSSALAVTAALAAIGAVLLLPRTGRNPPAPRAAGQVTVAAHERSFDRADIEITAGTTVEWRNPGSTTHHLVRILGGATVEDDLRPGTSARAVFEEPGTFAYYCSIHPGMTGEVTVEA